MRWKALALISAAIVIASPAQGQSVAELRAQYQQTMELLNQGEAAGMDPGVLSSLRESLDGLKQTIDEMERDQGASSNAETLGPEPTLPAQVVANAEPNLAADTCGRFGFNEENYRERAVASGDDTQIRAMCGQAYEYYAMYKRALGQGHPEAWKTYDAHKQSAAVLDSFSVETQTAPHEGIEPDTKTARDAVGQGQATAPTVAEAPPPAPSCDGCVSPQ